MTMIEITMVTFDYPIFEETYAWTLESFLGAFGGAVGLWLGLDFINTLKFISTTITSVFCPSILKTKKNTAKSKINSSERKLQQRENRGNVLFSIFKIINNTTGSWTKSVILKFLLKMAMFLIFGVLTMIFTTRFVQEYKSEPTQPSLEIMFNQAIILPNAVVCLPLFPGELDDTQRNISIPFNNVTSAAHFDNLIAFFNKDNLTKEYFLGTEWPNPILHIIHTYLALLSYCETYDDYGIQNCSEKDIFPPWTADLDTSDYLSQARKFFETKIQALNVSTDELRQKLGKEVAHLYSFFSIYGSLAKIMSTSEIIQDFRTVKIIGTLYVGANQICYEIDLSNCPLTMETEIIIQASETTLPWPYVFRSNLWITIDFRKRYWSDSDRVGEIARILFGQNDAIFVSIRSVYQALPYRLGKTRCSNTVTFDECTANCRIEYIKTLCNCSATTWPELETKNKTYCNLEKYRTCLNINGTEDSDCKSKCLDLCQRSTYQFYNINYSGNKSGSSALLSMKNFEYQVFEETFEWTVESFAGAFGGIIGLFLGLDFFSISQYFYDFVLMLVGKCRQAMKRSVQNSDAVIEIIQVTNSCQNISTARQELQESNINYLKLKCRNFVHWLSANLFKIITIPLLCYLIGRRAANFIQEYHSNKTVPGMTLMLQQNISLPKSTICVELQVGELYDQSQIAEGSASFMLQDSIENYFENTNITKESLLGNETWPNFLIHVTHAYLSCLTESEAAFSIHLSLRLLPFFYDNTDLFYAAYSLDNFTTQLNVTTDELRDKFGRDVNFLYLSLNATQITGNTVTEIGIGRTTSVSGWGMICYQIPFDQYPFFYGQRQVIRITSANDDKTIPNNKLSGTRMLGIDFTGGNRTGLEPYAFQLEGKDVSIVFNSYLNQAISVDSVFRSLPTVSDGKAQCSQLVSLENCRATCRLNLIQRLCNCSATSWSYLAATSDRNECKLIDYLSCLKFNATADSECMSECVGLCDHWKYRFVVDNTTYPTNGGQIELIFVSFDYPMFEQQVLWTFDEFTGELGNVLGFYVGLDFLTIIEFLLAKIVLLITVARPRF